MPDFKEYQNYLKWLRENKGVGSVLFVNEKTYPKTPYFQEFIEQGGAGIPLSQVGIPTGETGFIGGGFSKEGYNLPTYQGVGAEDYWQKQLGVESLPPLGYGRGETAGLAGYIPQLGEAEEEKKEVETEDKREQVYTGQYYDKEGYLWGINEVGELQRIGYDPTKAKGFEAGGQPKGMPDETWKILTDRFNKPEGNWEWGWSEQFQQNVWKPSKGAAAWQQPGEGQTDQYGRTATWNERTGTFDYPPNWGKPKVSGETGLTSWEQEQLRLKEQELAKEPHQWQIPEEGKTDPHGRQATWNARTGNWDYPPNWGVDPATLGAEYISPWQQQQIDLARQQQEAETLRWEQQQAQEQQNYLAGLRARPASWLEYAGAAGTTPAVQPWMTPLMGQDYAGVVAGEPIPGWQGTQPTLQDLPALTNPSAQYASRMGPTAWQQFQGYRQARTGAPPEETLWRQQQAAPPGGYSTQLSYRR